ncbi:MAG: hypothetical protein ABIM40_13600 [Pseudomonadota bacterium]
MDKKKVAAAVGGVMRYMADQEIAAPPAPAPVPVAVNLWGLAGRQQIMMMRNLLQMRLGQGLSPRR